MRAPSALLLAIALSLAAPAHGDDPALEARAHFDAGLKAFEAGEYDRAVIEFQAAYTLKPHPDLLINLGTSCERMYLADRAKQFYEQFLAEAASDSDLRPLAERRLRVLRSLPGSVLVDAGVAGATVHLSGVGVDRIATASAGPTETGASPVTFSALPPGKYEVHISAPGFVAIEEHVDLKPTVNHAITQRMQREHASVTVFSTPDGARVFLDGQDTTEVTPFSRDIETGDHQIRLELPDRAQRDLNFRLDFGRPFFKQVILPPPPRSGRTEMLLASMVFGGYAGGALTVAIGGNKVTAGTGVLAPLLAAAAGIGLGALGSWVLTDDAMKVGHSSIISGSVVWGTFAGLSLSYGLGLTGASGQSNSQQYTMALSLLGGGLGLGAGIVTAWLNDTSAGDAALVNSGALWGTASTLLLTEAISFRSPQHDLALGWLTLGGNAFGLVTGALLARGFEISRSHVAVIDAAGLLGTIVGYGIGYAAGHDGADLTSGTVCPGPVNRCVSGARYALGGMALGLLAAGILTRGFKFDLPKTEALLQRHQGRWQLGLPNVHLGSALTPTGSDQRAILDLARGDW